MKCLDCGKDLPGDSIFCPFCGSKNLSSAQPQTPAAPQPFAQAQTPAQPVPSQPFTGYRTAAPAPVDKAAGLFDQPDAAYQTPQQSAPPSPTPAPSPAPMTGYQTQSIDFAGQVSGGYAGPVPGGYAGQMPGGYAGQVPGGFPGQKKKHTGLIIGLSIGGAFLALMLFSVIIALPSILNPYKVGTLVGDHYTNEWANMQLTIPAGFEQASSSKLADIGTSYENVELYLRDGTDAIYFSTYDLQKSKYSTADEYVNAMVEQSNGEDEDMSYSRAGPNTTLNIAGKDYVCAHMNASYLVYDFDVMFLARKLGDHLVVITVFSDSASQSEQYARLFTAIK